MPLKNSMIQRRHFLSLIFALKENIKIQLVPHLNEKNNECEQKQQ